MSENVGMKIELPFYVISDYILSERAHWKRVEEQWWSGFKYMKIEDCISKHHGSDPHWADSWMISLWWKIRKYVDESCHQDKNLLSMSVINRDRELKDVWNLVFWHLCYLNMVWYNFYIFWPKWNIKLPSRYLCYWKQWPICKLICLVMKIFMKQAHLGSCHNLPWKYLTFHKISTKS